MLKIFTAVCLSVLLTCSAANSQTKSDLESRNLRGKIKSIEVYNLQYGTDGKWSKRELWTAETFNDAGNVLERSVFRDGRISSKVVNLYDVRGRKTGENSYGGSTGRLAEIPTLTELTLDNAGRTIELKVYYNGAATAEARHTYKYDGRGNMLETDYGLAGKSTRTYDARNNQTSQLNSKISGIVYNKNFGVYNERNQITRKTIYEGEELRYEIKYQYDAQDRLSEIETNEYNRAPNALPSSHAPEPGKLIYDYDDRTKTSRTTKYSLAGTPEPNSTSIYDARGEQIGYSCETSELQSCRTVVERETDGAGNTIKETYYDRSSTGAPLSPRSAQQKVITYLRIDD